MAHYFIIPVGMPNLQTILASPQGTYVLGYERVGSPDWINTMPGIGSLEIDNVSSEEGIHDSLEYPDYYLDHIDIGITRTLAEAQRVAKGENWQVVDQNGIVVWKGTNWSPNGGAGNDTIVGSYNDDTIQGFAGNDVLSGYVGRDTLIGGAGNDQLHGEDDTNVSGGGDILMGGAGNDVYWLDQGDRADETGGSGYDTVYVLGDRLAIYGAIEKVILGSAVTFFNSGSTAATTIIGNANNDNINSGPGNDTLLGGLGNDTLAGGDGNDLLIGGTGADRLTGGNGGQNDWDTASYSAATAGLTVSLATPSANTGEAAGDSYASIEHLVGSAFSDLLVGDGNSNILNGSGGADRLRGLGGSDGYSVDNAGDIVDEAAASSNGVDLVYARLTFSLANTARVLGAVENLTLTGTAAINGTGNSLNNVITGNAGANTLVGAAGNDTLSGGGGTDRLYGGLGNDVYVIDGGDTIVELASQGTDTVRSSASFVLASTLEHLALTGTAAVNGTGNALNNSITGNAAANLLNGAAGNDTLNGGAGIDTMSGGVGNDTFYVDNAGDKILEAAGQGTDSVYSSVSYALAAGRSIERMATTSLTGNGALNLKGNEFAQAITGNSGANVLSGLGGNDTLTGGDGSDYFVFDTGLSPTANVDRITDFRPWSDKIRLDNAVMAGLGPTLGVLGAGKFWSSTTGLAHDSDDRIIYETDTGRLFYDSNGNAAGGAVLFAVLSTNLVLNNTHFQVI